MNVLPVITRELRAQARQNFTFTLRGLGVVALLCAGLAFAVTHPFAPNFGGWLFRYLHVTLFFAIWILIPLSAADCISRERREGTLGLLFLTPLKPADIVIAKGLAHGLRAATLLVAVLPVLTIPFLLGGLSWQHALTAALTNFSAICWALAAALVSSSGNRSGLRAMVGALLFAVGGFVTFAYVVGVMVTPKAYFNFIGRSDYLLLIGLNLSGIGTRNFPFSSFAGPGWSQTDTLLAMLRASGVSALVLVLAILLAAFQIRRTWRDEPPPWWVQWWQQTFCTPVVWVSFFRRWMRWKLERNPIGWLEQRTWTGRLVTWAWFAIIISIYSAAFTAKNFFQHSNGMQLAMGWLLMGSVASSAAGSFRRERETGVLELLLVAPLTTNQIIAARVRGLWGQFLPAVATLLGIWFYFARVFKDWDDMRWVWFFALTFLTLPVIGLYFSVRCRHFVSAFLLTLITSLAVPFALSPVITMIAFIYSDPLTATYGKFAEKLWLIPSLIQGALALLSVTLLRRRLGKRDFPLERTAM